MNSGDVDGIMKKETKVDVFMTIFWGDWMRDTSHLSLQEQGAYLMLVRNYWNNRGALNDDKTRLYRSCGAQTRSEKESINLILETYFLHENGAYHHKRVDAELAKAIEYKEKKIGAGRAGGVASGESKRKAKGEANAKPSPSPSPTANAVIKEDTNVSKKKTNSDKVSLNDLSVDHIQDWLIQKRSAGKYIHHDENHVLEVFTDYCRSKGKTYKDYVAGLRNAFDWDRFNKQGNNYGKPKHSGFAEQDWKKGTEGFEVIG